MDILQSKTKEIIDFLEEKHPSEDWYIFSKKEDTAVVAVPHGESKEACEKILDSLGIKVIEDRPSYLKNSTDFASSKFSQNRLNVFKTNIT